MSKKVKPETGEVFKAYNKYMDPPKEKFHLCINEKMYLLINSKPYGFTCEISPQDCSLLDHTSYINCVSIRTEPIKEFEILYKEQLSTGAILKLIDKIKCSPGLSKIQRDRVIPELENCLRKRCNK